MSSIAGLWIALATSAGPCLAQGLSEEADPVTVAFEKCAAAPVETQKAVIAEIARRIEQTDNADLRKLLDLREEARKNLKTGARADATFYDPAVYAAGQNVVRTRVDPHSDSAKLQLATYRTYESEYPFHARVGYDFGTNLAFDLAAELPPADELWNFLYGYPPSADVLVAWLEQSFDHDKKFDAYARHFAHLYCELDGRCFPDITLYDAFASREKIDMPDVDVIPFAREILKDGSFRSPIPPGQRRDKLYAEIKRAFLPYFQHRTFVEAAATLYLDPEAPLRPEHEPLRVRLLYLFTIKKGDPKAILELIRTTKDRNAFILKIDELQIADPKMDRNRVAYKEERNKTRWVVAEIAYAVLREYKFLEDG